MGPDPLLISLEEEKVLLYIIQILTIFSVLHYLLNIQVSIVSSHHLEEIPLAFFCSADLLVKKFFSFLLLKKKSFYLAFTLEEYFWLIQDSVSTLCPPLGTLLSCPFIDGR